LPQSGQRDLPTFRQLKAATMPPAGHAKNFNGAALLTTAFKSVPRQLGTRRSWNMDLTNVALVLILIAMILLVPCGCVMTRSQRKTSGPE
jgi:uncharacterized membrane protein